MAQSRSTWALGRRFSIKELVKLIATLRASRDASSRTPPNPTCSPAHVRYVPRRHLLRLRGQDVVRGGPAARDRVVSGGVRAAEILELTRSQARTAATASDLAQLTPPD
jgi:hypothetical protein